MSKTAKTIADEVLTPARVRELWTANYLPALPFTPQNFDIGTLLPAMLYMARWGQRRGKGAFKEAFGSKINGKAEPPTIENVASGLLAKQAGVFDGFGDPYAQSLLADLLLTYSLENKGHEDTTSRCNACSPPTTWRAGWICRIRSHIFVACRNY